MSINEWKVSQPRVVILTRTAYYRVTYNPKNGKIDHYHKTTLDKLRVLEKTVNGLKVYLTEQAKRPSTRIHIYIYICIYRYTYSNTRTHGRRCRASIVCVP